MTGLCGGAAVVHANLDPTSDLGDVHAAAKAYAERWFTELDSVATLMTVWFALGQELALRGEYRRLLRPGVTLGVDEAELLQLLS